MVDSVADQRNKVLKFILRSVMAKKSRIFGYVGVGTVLYLSSVGLIATSVYLISRAALRPQILTLGILIAGTRYFALSRSVSRYLERLISHSVVLGGASRLRVAIFRALTPLFPQEASRLSSGEVLGKVSASVEDVQDLLLRLVGPLVLLIATAILVLLFGLAVQPLAGVVIFAGMAVFAVSGALVLAGSGVEFASEENSARLEFAKRGADVLRANEEFFLAGTLDSQLEVLGGFSAAMEVQGSRKLQRSANRSGMAAFVAQLIFVATVFLSIRAVDAHSMGAIMVGVMPMVAQVGFEAVQSVVAGSAAAPWYLKSMEDLPIDTASEPPPEQTHVGLALEIRFVRTVITRGLTAIGPLEFCIPAGSKCAIVGVSGVGKTTVAFAMLGYVQPSSGRVDLNGPDGPEGWLEAEIGYMPEKPSVLESTLRSNLAIANPSATDSEMAKALETVSLSHLLDHPEGLDRLLEGFGTQLSGGERQRLAMARLLLAGFGTVILDEPTASLDRDSADAVMGAVMEAFSGKTIIVITHERTLLGAFDQVIELL